VHRELGFELGLELILDLDFDLDLDVLELGLMKASTLEKFQTFQTANIQMYECANVHMLPL
jgi:hypothetical protein